MDLIASLQCADQPGIVHAMTSAVLDCGGNIIENQQFTDPTTNTFVMRTRFETSQGIEGALKSLNEGLSKYNPSLHIRPTAQKPRALVMVTKESHCLRDLLYLEELGELGVPVIGVASSKWTQEVFKSNAESAIRARKPELDESVLKNLLTELSLVVGDYEEPDTFKALAEAIKGYQLPVIYLAIAPENFEKICQGLAAVGITKRARVVVEKPFGR
ncbi:MAG: hypothetical protein EBW25_05065, partial [Actinobacteria bacterium]|nr:hypothetical protein [Actinomycetota bacterium]